MKKKKVVIERGEVPGNKGTPSTRWYIEKEDDIGHTVIFDVAPSVAQWARAELALRDRYVLSADALDPPYNRHYHDPPYNRHYQLTPRTAVLEKLKKAYPKVEKRAVYFDQRDGVTRASAAPAPLAKFAEEYSERVQVSFSPTMKKRLDVEAKRTGVGVATLVRMLTMKGLS